MDSTFEIDNDISRGKCLHVDGNNDENEFNSNIVSNTSNQKFDSELQLQTSEHEQHSNNKEIAQIHSARQNEETLVVMVNTESPNKVLHDILTHKQGDSNLEDLEEVKVTENIYSDSNDEWFLNDGDLSPRAIKAIKSARKGKKQGHGDISQPVRVQPKRQVSSLFAK
ncbi:hypothetical protein KY284_033783 [Solanum tuberosum]|nr:hypothetical protein KY284_033783 [Solanum tuberosum]